jgi:hypothetical protein
MSGRDGLRPFARGDIAAERDAFAAPSLRDFKFERRPGYECQTSTASTRCQCERSPRASKK